MKGLNINYDRFRFPDVPTPENIQAMFGPAKTLGASEEARLAMDAQLEESGVYSLLQHSLQLGQMPGLQFLGYGMLQSIAQNGLVRACIETVADDMTREWITLKGGDSVDELKEVLQPYNLQALFHDAAALVGYEGGAFIFIDTGAEGEALRLPLRPSPYSAEIRNGKLDFVLIDPVNVAPGAYNSSNPLRKDYFQPASWQVLGQEVHKSRLVRLVANEVPTLLKPAYNFLGMAQAQILWDYVLHFQECREAVARLLTKFSLTVFKTDMEAQITDNAAWDQVDARIRALAMYRNNDGVLAIDNSEEVIKLETPLSGVTDIVRQALEFLAALNRTPAVKLLGISPSGFNATGESDIRNYYDHVKSQQEKVLRHGIQRCLDFVMVSHFGRVDKDIVFEFNELGQEDEAALANVRKTRADILTAYLAQDVISVEEARQAIADDEDSGLAFIDPEAAPEASNMPTSPDDPAGAADAIYDWLENMAGDGEEDGKWITTKGGKRIEIDEKTGEILKGNVGQENGPAAERAKAIQEKIDSIRIEPGKDNVLPNLNRETLEEIGKADKSVLLKKTIFERNANVHPDVSQEEAASLIGQALYNPIEILNGNKEEYINFIAIDKERHGVVLLDVEDAKDNFEVVHWHYLRPESLRGLEKKGKQKKK